MFIVCLVHQAFTVGTTAEKGLVWVPVRGGLFVSLQPRAHGGSTYVVLLQLREFTPVGGGGETVKFIYLIKGTGNVCPAKGG